MSPLCFKSYSPCLLFIALCTRKDESDQYVDDVALRALIEKYSEFIAFPIQLRRLVTKPEEVRHYVPHTTYHT